MITNPENVVSLFKAVIEEGFISSRVLTREEGHLNKVEQGSVWIRVSREAFHRAVAFMKDMSPLHISCPVASRELEEGLELIYPFTLFSGDVEFKELPVMISVVLPYNDLTIRTVTDIVPGILYMERELQEMLGVVVEDIPDGRRLFTPEKLLSVRPFRSQAGGDAGLSKAGE